MTYDVHRTMQEGSPVTARVAHFELQSMAAQTHGLLTLEWSVTGRDTVVRELTLPATLASRVRGDSLLDIRVRGEGNGRPVILELHRVQRRMALINAVMALVGGLLATGAVLAWGRTFAPAYGDR